MTFRAKVWGFSLSIGGVAIVLAAVVGVTINLIARDDERLGRMLRLSSDIRSAETLASEILLGGGRRPHEQWSVLSLKLRRNIRDLSGIPSVTPGLLDELASRIESMNRAFTRLSDLQPGASPAARNILAFRIQADKGALVSRISALEAEVRAAQSAGYRLAVGASLVVIAFLLLLAVVHHLVMRRFLTGAWSDLTNAIGRIDNRELALPISTTRRDEFGQMLTSLDALRERLHAKIAAEDSARRNAEELSRVKSQFIASVSHELRTPLMSLLGLMDLADRRATFDEVKQDLSSARKAGGHLLDLINQILDFSKIEANKLEIAAEPFHPDSTLKLVESIFAAQAVEKGLQLEMIGPSAPPASLVGDPQRLTQVLFNLVGNAIKFTDSGKVTVRYEVTASGPGTARLRVDIVDTGPGVPPEIGTRVFDDFVQARTSGAPAKVGTGLGLAISARLVRLMGGQIGLVPDTAGGAHFYISIELPEATEAEAPAPAVSRLRPSRPLRILLVEDVATNRMIVREILASEGHVVDEADNGQTCLGRLRDARYDVVLMDINMPVMDGLDATRAIRATDAPWNRVPIVGLTANAFQQQVDGYLVAGMDACISKPVEWSELLSTLAAVSGTAHAATTHAGVAARSAPVATVDDPAPPLIDEARLTELLSLLGPEKLGTVVNRSQAVLRQNATEACAEDLSPAELGRILHTLRGAAANLGCARLAHDSHVLEQRSRSGDIDRGAIAGLPARVDHSVRAATEWLTERAVA